MNNYIKYALIANKASLGFHWVYDSEFLDKLSKRENLLFRKQDKKIYDKAKPSYYVYPNHEYSVQAMILNWLYKALLKNSALSKDDYENLLYNHLRPGGSYVGYVESYAKKMILKRLGHELKTHVFDTELIDDHLVGFMPYLACREIGMSSKKAWELAQAFTTLDDYPKYYQMFDYIFDHIKTKAFINVLKDAIDLAPKSHQESLIKAIEMDNTKEFISKHAGIACQISQSIPLIIHILSHVNSFEDMLHLNTKIGGASSDRGLLLGAILSQVYKISDNIMIMSEKANSI